MKKSFIIFGSLCLLGASMSAQSPSVFIRHEHYPLSMGYLPNFNPGKLTVLSTYGWKHFADVEDTVEGSADGTLSSYDQVISINGRPAEEFQTGTEAMEAALHPGEDGYVTIRYFSMRGDKEHTIRFIPDNIITYGEDENDVYADGVTTVSKARLQYLNPDYGMQILSDNDVPDWSKYRRIAFQPTSNNTLVEKDIARKVLANLNMSGFPFIYDEENPDLILTVAFDEDSQVTTTYVPQTTHFLDNGSNTYVYNIKGRTYVNSFKRPHSKVTEGGYTHKDVTTNHFLEVSVLDAHKMLDSTQVTPPILWQLRYKKSYDAPISLDRALNKVLSGCRTFPCKNTLVDPVFSWSGICWDRNKPIITYIYSFSPAEKLGLQPGDEILKIDGKNAIKFVNKFWKNSNPVASVDLYSASFKNKSWYDMLKNDCKIDPFSAVNDFSLPDPNQHYDENEVRIEPDVFRPNSEHEIEIKRNGKKMKLYGPLYGPAYFFDATQKLPKFNN